MAMLKQNPYLITLKKLIFDYIKNENINVKIYLFGSRAKGSEHSRSDVDIAIAWNQRLPIDFIARLKEKIEESTIPYSVDLVELSQLELIFQKKILTEGIEWTD